MPDMSYIDPELMNRAKLKARELLQGVSPMVQGTGQIPVASSPPAGPMPAMPEMPKALPSASQGQAQAQQATQIPMLPPKPAEQITLGQISSVPDYVARFLVDLSRRALDLPEMPPENPVPLPGLMEQGPIPMAGGGTIQQFGEALGRLRDKIPYGLDTKSPYIIPRLPQPSINPDDYYKNPMDYFRGYNPLTPLPMAGGGNTFGRPLLVGEEGPELVYTSGPTTVIPNHQLPIPMQTGGTVWGEKDLPEIPFEKSLIGKGLNVLGGVAPKEYVSPEGFIGEPGTWGVPLKTQFDRMADTAAREMIPFALPPRAPSLPFEPSHAPSPPFESPRAPSLPFEPLSERLPSVEYRTPRFPQIEMPAAPSIPTPRERNFRRDIFGPTMQAVSQDIPKETTTIPIEKSRRGVVIGYRYNPIQLANYLKHPFRFGAGFPSDFLEPVALGEVGETEKKHPIPGIGETLSRNFAGIMNAADEYDKAGDMERGDLLRNQILKYSAELGAYGEQVRARATQINEEEKSRAHILGQEMTSAAHILGSQLRAGGQELTNDQKFRLKLAEMYMGDLSLTPEERDAKLRAIGIGIPAVESPKAGQVKPSTVDPNVEFVFNGTRWVARKRK